MKKGPLKWHLSVNCRPIKMNSEGEEIFCEPYFTSHCFQLLIDHYVHDEIQEAIDKILIDLDNYNKELQWLGS